MTLIEVMRVYEGSDGDATKAIYARLEQLGPVGLIALNLFRANKCSARAKVYRGGIRGRGSYRSMAYDRKNWSIDNLCKILGKHADGCGIRWGWGVDPKQPVHSAVLYVETPTGQVSFHTEARGLGPDYPGQWDGVRGASPERICRWVAQMLSQEMAA